MQLYNTLARKVVRFEPIKPNEVGIYTCGPTVYQRAHIGNFRTYILGDMLRRVLEYAGFAVKHVMNITDVGHLTGDNDEGDDKFEASSRLEQKTAWEVASFYTDKVWEDADRLHILRPTIVCKATEHIAEQIRLIQRLEEKGFTYKTSDGIYFSVERFPAYGVLTGQNLADKEAGARVEVNAEKHHPADFALWKFSYPNGRSFDSAQDDVDSRRQMEWLSPWGIGFPGWHIECSAMSTKYLGQPFDIHTGGEDLIAPHHTNEIAQSEAAFDTPLANYWLHGAFMLIDGEKMSKSLGNVYTVQDLIDRGQNPLSFRLLTLMTHYRKTLNFSWESLASAEQALQKLTLLVRQLPKIEGAGELEESLEEQFRACVEDDLNMPQALALLWETLKSSRPASEKAAAVVRWDQVFGLGLADFLGEKSEISQDIQELLNEREMYRAKGQYDRADSIRDELLAKGYEIQDGQDGATVVPKTGSMPL
ncbi:MAG: cysteine--tRNA ligase [Patescibacteria group bacterium]